LWLKRRWWVRAPSVTLLEDVQAVPLLALDTETLHPKVFCLSARRLPSRITNEVAYHRTRPAAATAQRSIAVPSRTTVSSSARLATGQAWTGTISNVSPISTSLPAGSRRSQPCSSDSRTMWMSSRPTELGLRLFGLVVARGFGRYGLLAR
jgi:hypothetical protein